MADNMTPEVRKGMPGVVKGAIAVGVLATAGLGAAVGLGAFNRGEPRPDVTPTPSAAAGSPTPSPDRTVIATPTGKVEVTLSPTPEIKAFDCNILTPELCAQGELIIYKSGDQETKYIAWKDLPVGTPLRSFIDGQRTIVPRITSSTSPFQGASGLSIFTPDRKTAATFIGSITIPENPTVNKGQAVGSVADGGVKIFGEFKLIFTADDATLKALFGKTLEGPSKKFSSSGNSGSAIITNPNYSNKP